jgi:5-methylcytosine-specific restriction endonuclease McrA
VDPIPSLSIAALLRGLSDDELLKRLSALLRASRRVEAVLVAHLGEVDARRLFAREAFPSMFAYCTDALHLSEPEAYLRITVARAARDHPVILGMLADGRLHLSGIAKLVPHLTSENGAEILDRASLRSKRQIEEMLAELVPRPAARDLVRRLPEGRTMRSSTPDGSLFALLDRAVSELVARLEGKKFGLTSRPRKRGEARVGDRTRSVPSDVRRTVFARDEGRCRFVGAAGHRCPARRGLEFHHVQPYARGGAASVANIQLMGRTHNALLASRDFGGAHMESFRKGPPSRRPPPAPSRAG